jgi:hypothetical protein
LLASTRPWVQSLALKKKEREKEEEEKGKGKEEEEEGGINSVIGCC